MGRRPKKTFIQRRHTDGQEAQEKMPISPIIREMQIKTTMRYHLTLVRMAIIKKPTINAGEGVEKGEPSYSVGQNVNCCSHYVEQYGGSLKN